MNVFTNTEEAFKISLPSVDTVALLSAQKKMYTSFSRCDFVVCEAAVSIL